MYSRLFPGAIIVSLLLVGCIPSLNPIYTEGDLVFDDSLLGIWQPEKDSGKWKFTKRDEHSYRVAITDKSGRTGKFLGHLADLKGSRFLDLTPDPESVDGNDFYKAHFIAIHTSFLVKQTKPKLVLAAPDYQWLDGQLDGGQVAFSKFGDRKVLTGATEELQAFVIRHQDKFTAEVPLVRAEK